ncbi:MAG TPA: FxLYD domain-containing protein [Candidatus Cryosericum sp.]|nr:FxLYD domain-containing protein [Candidatus Cryosericum sp.]
MTWAPAPSPAKRPRLAAAILLSLLAAAQPLGAGVNSARYRFEGNRWLALDLAVAEVRTDVIRFDWPSTMLGFKTRYKAVIKVANASTNQVSVGVVVAVFDGDGKLLGAGTSGTKVGTIDPGDTAEFTIDFDHVTERLEAAAQFQVALQTR